MKEALMIYYSVLCGFALILGMIIGGLISNHHWSNVCELARETLSEETK